MSKKILLVAGMVLATLAFAIPAGAMGSETFWAMEGSEETEEFQFEAVGEIELVSLGSGFRCTETATYTANVPGLPSSTGIVHSKIEKPTANCVGSGTTFLNCQVKEIENTVEGTITSLYHAIQIGSIRYIIITGAEYSAVLEGKNCLDNGKTITFRSPELEAIPNNYKSISSLALQGEGVFETEGFEFESSILGELEVVGEASGTYGLL